MYAIFKNKTLRYGVGTFFPNTTKNVFKTRSNQPRSGDGLEYVSRNKCKKIAYTEHLYSTKQD